jgi:hypothetical protein
VVGFLENVLVAENSQEILPSGNALILENFVKREQKRLTKEENNLYKRTS